MKYIQHLLLLLFSLGAIACSEDTDPNPGEATATGTPITMTAEIAPRINGNADSWSVSNTIGLFQYRAGSTFVANGVNNLQADIDASGKVTPSAALLMEEGSRYDFYGYSPYDENLSVPVITLSALDQHNPQLFDLLYSRNATAQTLEETGGTVKLVFEHVLAKLSFTLHPGTKVSAEELQTATFRMEGVQTSGQFNLAMGTFSALNSEEAVSAVMGNGDNEGITATIIVIPQQVETVTYYLTLADGREIKGSFHNIEFRPSKVHTYDMTPGESGIEIVPGEIVDWTDTDREAETGEGEEWSDQPILYAIGDYYPNARRPEGIVFEVSEGGLHGKIVSLYGTESESLRWGSLDGKEYSGDPDLDDGRDVTAYFLGMVQSMTDKGDTGWLNDHTVWKWFHEKLTDGTLSGDWYCPAINELKSLFASIYGIDYNNIADTWSDYTQPMPGFAAIVNKEALQNSFDEKLSSKGGTKFNWYGKYGSTSEIEGTSNQYRYVTTDGNFATTSKSDTSTRLRPIKRF